MRLWGNKSGPCMQVLHFSWAFGAFVAPLIAKHFIREVADDADFNGTCSDLWTNTSTTTNSVCSPQLSNDCFLLFTELCENLTIFSEDNNLSFSDMNCTSSNTQPPTDFKYAYFIAASLFLPSLIAFIFYAVKRECFGKCCSKLYTISKESDKQMEANHDTLSSEEKTNQPPLYYTIVFFTVLFCFMFLYVGLEAGFGSLIFTVAVKGELCFSKSSAALLQSVYWGTFCFTRLFSVTLAVLQVRASIMIAGNLFGSFIASLIMIFYIHNATAIWIGSAVLGMSYASIFPTAMTWMSENAKATGKATAVLVTAGTVGDITLPAVMGAIVAQIKPDALFYFTFVGVIISAGTAGVMFLTACLQKRKYRSVHSESTHRVKYKQLTEDLTLECEDGLEVSEMSSVNGNASLDLNHVSRNCNNIIKH